MGGCGVAVERVAKGQVQRSDECAMESRAVSDDGQSEERWCGEALRPLDRGREAKSKG